eukprot:CAMPEP_0180478248 /NCGR_PEP_ID=MMETSP1036_2-20121128/32683_1 /TAXON_ID=632150 /ORGANISM="Azadinium spinosum, Strain 3D9" /LENGTH=94 /DNA_ID=CAMNT_0022485767 /DNA_START=315 /DNA_END=599 /DNA_ORIENTATION=-
MICPLPLKAGPQANVRTYGVAMSLSMPLMPPSALRASSVLGKSFALQRPASFCRAIPVTSTTCTSANTVSRRAAMSTSLAMGARSDTTACPSRM